MSELDRQTVEKYWNNLPNYFEGGKNKNILCVIDTSGSMTGCEASAPINVAISLGIYAGERCAGPFKDHYISFSSKPQFVDFSDANSLHEKLQIAKKHSEVSNTNIEAVFNLILQTAIKNSIPQNEMIKNILSGIFLLI